jgi:uncharacterized protein (TIGR00730 family)
MSHATQFKSVAVYCSAREGLDGPFTEAARETGRVLGERGIELVYGGGGLGLMGVVATAALEAGGRVVGVIPRSMVEKERAHGGLTERIVVTTMHERKAIMAERAGAFLALPGGVGTLDEIFEAITWNQLAIHDKPVGFLDVEGFYAPLRAFLERAHAGGFIPASTMYRLRFGGEAGALLETMGI